MKIGTELMDAKRALGMGLVFFGYAAILLLEHLRKQDAFRQAFRRWASENSAEVAALRDKLTIEEGL